ncbi:MAG: hypothetical protein II826_09995 [Prevotella sp.]|nr:hypothetical protein [Prevotella sp.]
MKKILTFAAALLIGTGSIMADEVSVGDVTIPQGGQATVNISLTNPDKVYTAGQMLMVLPESVNAVLKENGDPTTAKGERLNGTSHTVGASHLEDGTDQFTIFSISSEAIPGSEGPLFSITLTADAGLTVGTSLEGRLTNIELTTTDGVPAPFNNQTFTITIGEPADTHVLLDEDATSAPEAADGVDVRVRRTIKAGEWSTICLPFAMTEEQVKGAFGSDVQIGDFNDYEFDGDAISVKFNAAAAVEANHPYVIKVTADVAEFTVDGVDIDPQEAVVDFDTSRRKNQPRQMVGTYVAGTVLDWGTLFLSGNQFWYSTGNTKMKAFRAYFNFYDLLPDFEDNYESRQVKMLFGDNSTTGIKGIEDGRLKIEDSVYDLQGRRVASSTFDSQSSIQKKGIYVKDGKKVIIK